MGEKNKKNGEGKEAENKTKDHEGDKKKDHEGDKKKDREGDKKKDHEGDKNNVTVVLKADLHCEGCASKIIKCIRSFEGVDTATIGEGQKITVVGKVDPVELREKVEQKSHKKIQLISPLPKKDNNNSTGNSNQSKQKEPKDKSDDKKSKEKGLPVTTAVLKLSLHCEGCIKKIHKIVTKTKGYKDMKIDKQKDLVTVTGGMDMKALAEMLKNHLKRSVEIVPPKKEGEKKDSGGKEKSGGEGGKNVGEAGGGNKAQFQIGYPYPFMYGPGHIPEQFHYYNYPYSVQPYDGPQMLSDENPNACSIL